MVDFKKLMNQPFEPEAKRELWIGTIQMAKVPRATKKLEDDPYVYEDMVTGTWYLDTTTRAKHPLFQPGWDIVLGHKNGTVSDQEYIDAYLQRMRDSYDQNQDAWVKLLRDAYEGEHSLVLICFCRNGAFCHRYQLMDMFLKVCIRHKIPARYHGEWEV